jgi:hypothetical protein
MAELGSEERTSEDLFVLVVDDCLETLRGRRQLTLAQPSIGRSSRVNGGTCIPSKLLELISIPSTVFPV